MVSSSIADSWDGNGWKTDASVLNIANSLWVLWSSGLCGLCEKVLCSEEKLNFFFIRFVFSVLTN
jgi:hypothetical protein